MRSILPWLVALAPMVSSFSLQSNSFQHIKPRQVGEPRQPSEAPKNTTLGEIPVNQATYRDPASLLSFAIVVNPVNGDIRFRMAGPQKYSWIAVGTGSKMAGSLMFVMYQGEKNNVTLSGRLSDGEVEPYYSPQINLTMIKPDPQDAEKYPNGIGADGLYRVTGLCRRCMNMTANSIDPRAETQQFIYAYGPRGRDSNSNSKSAPLRRHIYHGHFNLNIPNALGVGVPILQFNATDNSLAEGGLKVDPDFAESAHAFAMLLTFVIVIPLGIFFIRSLERVKIHMVLQSIALLLIIIGFATGIVISKLYNRSQKFNSAHQIIGIIVLTLILLQWISGFVSHRQFTKTGQNIKIAMQAHKLVLGPLAFSLGIVNAALGFRLALAGQNNYLYLPVMFVVIILMALTSWKKGFFMSRWGSTRRPTNPYNGGEYGQQTIGVAPGYGPPGHQTSPYQHTGAYATRSDIALTPMDAPPAYDSTPQKPREFA